MAPPCAATTTRSRSPASKMAKCAASAATPRSRTAAAGAVLFGDDWPWSVAGATLTTGAVPPSLASGAQAIMKTPWWGQNQHVCQALEGRRSHDHQQLRHDLQVGYVAYQALARAAALRRCRPDHERQGQVAPARVDQRGLRHDTIPLTVPAVPDYGPDVEARNTAVTAAKGTGWGLIATGDSMVSAVSPNLSHDGNSIVYVTTDYSPDGHPDATPSRPTFASFPTTTVPVAPRLR